MEDKKINQEKIVLREDYASYELNSTGDIGGLYVGVFKFRLTLTPLQELTADRDYRKLIGEFASETSSRIINTAYALAHLKQRVIEAPPFWFDGSSDFGGASVKDYKILEEVVLASVRAEEMYREMLKKRHEESMKKLQNHLKEMYEKEQKLKEEMKFIDPKTK
jgi:hypothetical protein